MGLSWDDTLSVDNALIDEQHRELFDKFEDLLQACKDARGKEKIGQLFLFLSDYVKTHFSAEERLMLANNYPEMTRHREEHEDFIKNLTELQKSLQLEGTTLNLIVQTNQVLLKWIVRHIKSADKALGSYLKRTVRA